MRHAHRNARALATGRGSCACAQAYRVRIVMQMHMHPLHGPWLGGSLSVIDLGGDELPEHMQAKLGYMGTYLLELEMQLQDALKRQG